jgi:N-acetylmuramoyl-L-alanine amidase
LEIRVRGACAHSVFTLEHPSRLVVDLTPATLDRGRVHLPKAEGAVQSVRTGPRAGGTLRVVLDLDRAVVARTVVDEAAGGSRRLTLELVPAGEAASPMPAVPPAPAVAAATPPVVPPAAPGRPSPGKVQKVAPPPRDLVIAIDAGHGGEDPGATGRDGTREKDVTLSIARTLAARVNAEPGMRAFLTRDGDTFVPLRERMHRARGAAADLFVSVHADAVPDRSVAGSSVYVLSGRGASTEAAKWLADRENAADLIGGVSLENKDNVLASVLLDLSQSAAMSASMAAAEQVLGELNGVGEVRKSRVQQAGFVVLKSPDIPSMLIETAYITNPGEEQRLRDTKYQARLADAILAGVRGYFQHNAPPGTRVAALAEPRTTVPGGTP